MENYNKFREDVCLNWDETLGLSLEIEADSDDDYPLSPEIESASIRCICGKELQNEIELTKEVIKILNENIKPFEDEICKKIYEEFKLDTRF